MIALLGNDSYFIKNHNNIKDFLITYATYINLDTKIFKILVDSNEMSIEELIEYINSHCWSFDDKITEIYETGEKIYGEER